MGLEQQIRDNIRLETMSATPGGLRALEEGQAVIGPKEALDIAHVKLRAIEAGLLRVAKAIDELRGDA